MIMTSAVWAGPARRWLSSSSSSSSSLAARRALNGRIVQCRRPGDLIALLRGEARTDADLAHLNVVNLCTSVHRLAKLGAAWTSVPDEIRAALVRRLHDHDLGGQHVSNLLWAFRLLRETGPDEQRLVGRLLARAEAVIPQITQPQLLSNLAWSLAGLGRPPPPPSLVERLVDRLLQLFVERDLLAQPVSDPSAGFRVQELSNTIWALPKLGAGSPALWDALARALPAAFAKAPAEITPQALSNVCLGFARTPHASDKARRFAFRAVGDVIEPRAAAFSEQALCNVAWALGKTRVSVPALLGHVTLALERRPAGVESVSHWVVVLWALSRTRFFHEPFFLACAERLPPRLSEFKDDELRRCLGSFRAAGIHAPKLFGAILQEADRRKLALFTTPSGDDEPQ